MVIVPFPKPPRPILLPQKPHIMATMQIPSVLLAHDFISLRVRAILSWLILFGET
jgi:hypothetical protein